MKVIKATAEYTGGGIYIYGGQLEDGRYFFTADDYEDYVMILDADPVNNEDACYCDWQEAHLVEELMDEAAMNLWKEILGKAIEALENGERMNASASELEERLGNLK